MTTTTTAPAAPWYRHYGWKGLIVPSIAVLALGVFGIAKLTKHEPQPTIDSQTVAQAAAQGAAQVLSQVVGPTTTAPPAALPGYDYLTCTHVPPADTNGPPCRPLLAWPLTREAQELIGYQSNPIVQGQLSTVKTRIVADQIRNDMAGVDACSMWLSLDRDEKWNPILKVWPNQAKAPQGAVKLCDCTPSAKGPQGTVPTDGAS